MRPRLLVKQIYMVGVLSVVIIAVSGVFVGMVLSLQGFYVLSQFGAAQSLGMMVAASLVRELGPVVTALLFAGRAGSALTAEIGLMKATEQLAGLEMMAVDPIRRILTPRFVAGCLSVPMLTAIFSAVGVLGGVFRRSWFTWSRRWGLLEPNALWNRFASGSCQWRYQKPSVWCSLYLDSSI